jgi:hypothetical protein
MAFEYRPLISRAARGAMLTAILVPELNNSVHLHFSTTNSSTAMPKCLPPR